jgi:uncharacterized repeat protein (TIGR01451 family)
MAAMRVADHGQHRASFGGVGLVACVILAAAAWCGTAAAQASLTVSKYLQVNSDPDGNNQVTVGDTLTYLVRAQNTGFVTLNNVAVSDSLITPGTQACAALNAYQVCDLIGTHVVTAADEAAGVIINTGSATADEITGARTATLNTAVVARSTAMAINKYFQSSSDPDANNLVTVGDTLSFLVRVQNTGNQPLHNVVVSDSRITPGTVTCPVLKRFEICDLNGTTLVTAADETAGSISNTGTGTATEITGARTATLNTVVAQRTTAMSVAKYYQGNNDPDANGLVTVGDTLSYLVRATNNGNQPLHNVVVSDPRLTPNTVTCPVLNRYQICDLTGTTTVTPADESAGLIANTGTATANEITVPRTATVNLTVATRSATMSFAKYYQANSDPDANFLVTAGDTLTYLVRVQNTGTDPLTNVVITDSRLTPSTVTCPVVNRNQLCDLNGTLLVTPADESAGQVANTATATANEITGSRTAMVSTPVTARSTGLSIAKYYQTNNDADGSFSITLGDTLTYLVRASNVGTQPLTNVVVSDSKITPNANTCATLNRSGNCDLTGTYTVTAADVAAGQVSNSASATATEITGARTVTINTQVVGATTALLVNTTYWSNTDPDGNGKVTVGDVITYRVLAQNTGSTTLSNVTVSAPALSPSSLNCPTLAPGNGCDLFATYTVTVADETAGVITINGSATSTEVPGPVTSKLDTPVSPRNTAMLLNAAYWTITDQDGNGQVTVGDVLTFRATAQNPGTQPLTNVTVSTPTLSPTSLNCPTVGASGVCDLFATYTVAAADETAGAVTVTATATSTEVPGPISATVTVPVLPRNTGMILNVYYWSNSDPDGNGLVTVGDTVTYRVLMQNSGSQPLTNVVVGAPLLSPASLTCPTVNAGGQCDLFATILVTSTHEAAGSLDISASATSTELPGPLTNSISTPVITRSSALVVNTSYWTSNDADANGQVTAGDTLTFRVLMQNGGTQPLTNVVVSAPALSPNSLTCASVLTGGSCDLFGTYVVTPADEAAGAITVTGSVTSTELPGPYTSSVTTPVIPRNTAMTFALVYWTATDPDGNGQLTAGDVITYRATMTNTGTQPITGVLVSTPQLSPASLGCATVNAGGICDLFATYTATAADASAGFVTITGSATSNEVPGPLSGSVTTAVRSLTPVLAVAKSYSSYSDLDSNGQITAGDVINYTIIATNVGYVGLTNVVVSDPMITPNSTTCGATGSGGNCTLFGTYTVTAADAAAGNVTNTASATSNETGTPVTDTLVTPVNTPVSSMSLAKVLSGNADGDGNGQVTQGDVLTYTVTATNTGSTTLTNLVVTDPLIAPNTTTCASVPAAGTCVLTGTYTVGAADVSAGSINNTGSATANEIGTPVTATLVTPVVAVTTAMTLAKAVLGNDDPDGNGQVTVGDTLTYHVNMQNTGTVTLTNVVVSDPLVTPNSLTCPSVAPTSTCILVGTYQVTSADQSAGSISNTGSVVSAEITAPVTASLNTPVVTPTVSMCVAKSFSGNDDPDGNGQITVGDTLTYHVLMTNTGTVTLTGVVVSDPLLTPNSLTCPSVGPAAVCDFAGTYTVTPADATAGSISNTGSAVTNEITTPVTDTLVTPVVTVTASMGLAKVVTGNADGDGNGQVTAGDVLTYTVTATNTGTVSLSNVVVSDPLLTPGSTGCGSVAPTQTCVLTGTYAVTAADAAAGSIANTATGNATELAAPVTASLSTPVLTITTAPTALAVISGDQQALDVGTASAPMVVELTSGGAPLAGQSIAWTTTTGTLSAASSVTDAAGRTSVTLTLTQVGAATVTAGFAGNASYAASSATFNHNSNIASVPALTPEGESVATALDNACVELQALANPTPQEQDLLAQCLALTVATGVDPDAVAEAVEQMLPDVAQTQAQASQSASTAQADNLNRRMQAVRTGQPGKPLAGLALVGSGGMLPLSGLQALLAAEEPVANDPDSSAAFSRWGFFASGRIGRGEADPGRFTPAYDFDIEGLTAGVDYRKTDNLVLGGALGYTRQDTDLAHQEGSLDTRGWSVSGYATWYRPGNWYIDGLLSWAHNTYSHRRRIVYALPQPDGTTYSVDQIARASSAGTDTTLSATFGRDYHKGGWAMGYYGRAIYTRLAFGGFTEEVDANSPGSGLALEVGSRRVTAVSSVLGARFDYAHSADWGVLTPHFDIEWQHEYKGDPGAFQAVFVNDPSGTPIEVLSEPQDKSYFRIGAGLSWVLPKGRSGFLYYDRMFGRDGMSQDNLTLGIRIEF